MLATRTPGRLPTLRPLPPPLSVPVCPASKPSFPPYYHVLNSYLDRGLLTCPDATAVSRTPGRPFPYRLPPNILIACPPTPNPLSSIQWLFSTLVLEVMPCLMRGHSDFRTLDRSTTYRPPHSQGVQPTYLTSNLPSLLPGAIPQL